MSDQQRKLIQLAHSLQQRAYSHGEADQAPDRSDKFYADAAEKSMAKLRELEFEIMSIGA